MSPGSSGLLLSDGVRPDTLALMSQRTASHEPNPRCDRHFALALRAARARSPGRFDRGRQVKTIRSRYDAVEKDLSGCKQVKRDLPGESAEGGELTAYFSGESLRKLVAKFYGETGQAREEYYFWDGRLFFVLRVESRYDKPLSGKVVSKSEERFYFADDALIRWLDPRKKEVSAGPEIQQRGEGFARPSEEILGDGQEVMGSAAAHPSVSCSCS